jgi:hypothetical protein
MIPVSEDMSRLGRARSDIRCVMMCYTICNTITPYATLYENHFINRAYLLFNVISKRYNHAMIIVCQMAYCVQY